MSNKSDMWLTLPKRKPGVIYCPLCGLPEGGNYKRLCHCWDEQKPNTASTGLGLSAAKSADTEPEVSSVIEAGSQPSR
jgi:predicted amidophosphoribosyltransferase